MGSKFAKTMFSPAAKLLQEKHHSRSQYERLAALGSRDEALGDFEQQFIAARDSFYLGSVTEDGWPYIQHRGGPTGFLHVLGPSSLAFADYKGNRQLLSTGNVAAGDRVALFLMDYPQQTRLKILGHARVEDARQRPELVAQLAEPDLRSGVERLFFIDVVSFDWNCPQHITPRYTAEDLRTVIEPLQHRIAELEAQLKK